MKFAAAASPHRVLLAVRFLAAVMETFSSTDEDSVTLVVSNLALSATLRAQNSAGADAISIIEKVLRHPDKALKGSGVIALDVAETIVAKGNALAPFAPSFLTNGRSFRDLTTPYLKELDQAAKEYNLPKVLRGTTVIHSRILRIGKTRARSATMARVVVRGRPYDLPIDPTLHARAWQVAMSDREAAITLDAVWGVEEEAHLLIPKRARICDIDSRWSPEIGATVVGELRSTLADEFADMGDVMDRLGIEPDVH